MTASTAHPAVAPVIEALQHLAAYRPSSLLDLADVLKSVNDLTNPANVIDALGDALICLGQRAERDGIATYLEDAAGTLASAAEDIDRARADTGHWNGSAGTDSYL
jgi:hypothetical protein